MYKTNHSQNRSAYKTNIQQIRFAYDTNSDIEKHFYYFCTNASPMTHSFNSPIGIVRLTEEDGAITRIELTDKADAPTTTPTPLLYEAELQIMAYLGGKRQQLDFPIRMVGTLFQQRVWHALQQIPLWHHPHLRRDSYCDRQPSCKPRRRHGV